MNRLHYMVFKMLSRYRKYCFKKLCAFFDFPLNRPSETTCKRYKGFVIINFLFVIIKMLCISVLCDIILQPKDCDFIGRNYSLTNAYREITPSLMEIGNQLLCTPDLAPNEEPKIFPIIFLECEILLRNNQQQSEEKNSSNKN
uniref:Uncharacterized protein n=1 Tax=Glossina pallidipes TaxID=7398 RepID=A0A1B0A7X4_GLOPL